MAYECFIWVADFVVKPSHYHAKEGTSLAECQADHRVTNTNGTSLVECARKRFVDIALLGHNEGTGNIYACSFIDEQVLVAARAKELRRVLEPPRQREQEDKNV